MGDTFRVSVGPSKATAQAHSVSRGLTFLPVALGIFCLLLQFRSQSPLGESPGEDNLVSEETAQSFSFNIPKQSPQQLAPDQEWGWSSPERITEGVELPHAKEGPKIAFATTTAAPLDDVKVWLRYHASLGVSLFYVFTNGQVNHPSAHRELEKWAGVKVFPNDERLKYKKAHSRAWNETWLSAFFNKPCNHELFVMQSLNMEVAIEQAREDGVEWIFHIDTDELIYPGGTAEFNLQQYLASVDKKVDTIVFPNYEGLAERDDVTDPFTQVTLFKRNFAHVLSEQYFKHYKKMAKGNPNYFTAYGNGKSGARIQPKLRPNGAHRWYIYGRKPVEITAPQAVVLHYIYNKYEDLKGRRDRCDCAPTEEDVKRCFILPFDRAAFIASSLKSDEELRAYFQRHLIWSNRTEVTELLKTGLVARVHAPQAMTRLYRQMTDAGLALAPPSESKRTIMDDIVLPNS